MPILQNIFVEVIKSISKINETCLQVIIDIQYIILQLLEILQVGVDICTEPHDFSGAGAEEP
jgi:hypothetical protein